MVFDDYSSIFENPAVMTPHHGLVELATALFSAPTGGLLRPLSMLSFILNADLTGMSPGGFKLVNILIHLACGLLLWFLAREILRAYTERRQVALDTKAIDWLSLGVATLWLVHPLNLTAVLYIVQRETSLSALFSVAAMLSYMAGRRHGLQTLRGKLLLWLGTPFFTLLGLLAKETAALVPVYLLVIEFTLLRGQDREAHPQRQVRTFFTVFLALPLIAAATLAAFKPGLFFASYMGRDFGMYERLLSECRVLLDYLRWIFLPDLWQLGLYHEDIAVSRGLLDPVTTLPAVLTVVALVAAGIICRHRYPLLSFGILWFFGGHLLESSVLPLELMFEHRNYLPLFGVVLACATTFYLAVQGRGKPMLARAGIIAAIGLLAFATSVRALDWHSELDFARSEARHHPQSPRALTELQWAYMEYVIHTRDTRLIPSAVSTAEQAKLMDPGSINQDVGLAYMYASIDDLPDAATRLGMAAARAPAAKPTATMQLSLQSLLELAKPQFKSLYPDIRGVFTNSLSNPRVIAEACYAADMWTTYAVFQDNSGEVPDALAGLHRAVNLCPGNAVIRWHMAKMLMRYGDTKDAAPQIDAMRKIDDFRYRSLLLSLEAEYARRTAGTGR